MIWFIGRIRGDSKSVEKFHCVNFNTTINNKEIYFNVIKI